MVKMRLKRMGAKKAPTYRIVISDSRDRRDGREIEVVGYYDPKTNPASVKVNEERAIYWLKNGALPTDTVRTILSKEGVIKKFADSKKVEK